MKEAISGLIKKANLGFNSQLIEVDIDEYTDKLLQRSTMTLHIINGQLAALIAYYDNDATLENAFLSMIIVDEEHKGKGLGKMLMGQMLQSCREKGFKSIGLEVHIENTVAIDLYKKYGFEAVSSKNSRLLMKMPL